MKGDGLHQASSDLANWPHFDLRPWEQFYFYQYYKGFEVHFETAETVADEAVDVGTIADTAAVAGIDFEVYLNLIFVWLFGST